MPTIRQPSVKEVSIEMTLPSLANKRMKWQKLVRIKNEQKERVARALKLVEPLPPFPVAVTVTRVGPRPMDYDNLVSSIKYVRDQVAEAVGVDDGDPGYQWTYRQELGKKYLVTIRIESRR